MSALKSKAVILRKKKKYTEAIDTLNEALKIDSENTDILIELAYNYKYLYDKLKVIEICKNIFSINSNHKEAIDLLKSV